MKEILQQETLDELADEVAEIVTNSKKLTEALKISKEQEIIQKRNLSEVTALRNRVGNLENRLEKFIKNFQTDIVEVTRLVSERYGDANRINDEKISNLQDQIEGLKDLIDEVRNEAKVKQFIKTQMR